MHAFQCLFLAVAIAPDGAFAEDSVHLVVIEAATSDVGSIRAQLLDPANISKPDAIDPLRKRKGITVHGDFRRALKWGLRVNAVKDSRGLS
jgi:hypothetical protein